ncbi:MAG: UvrD-helicase domain-containing protein [Solirubrobacterales bacterium]|nr:UvrD-helicase domain-containing protein [Solirubrobacterales bacterium]
MLDLSETDMEAPTFTDEQLVAIERREGDLLLAAGAGSGKTSVLVERFVRSVLEDGVEVGAILTITFTEKAAAEMRERIRRRLRELAADDAARATESAFISTIHGFCARLLRAHALAAGLDPAFVVLDAPDAERLADAAFDEALEALAPIELIASYTAGGLRTAIVQVHDELRSRGQRHPRLPALPPRPDLGAARRELTDAAAAAAQELGAIAEPGAKVIEALARLERCPGVIVAEDPWPGDLYALGLPGGNGAALSTEVCARYTEALATFRAACEHRRAIAVHDLLDRLLRRFAERYARAKREVSGLDFEDLELECRELLRTNSELRERYRQRFTRIMVDELQDTNQVQLDLIDLLARGNLFTVGDAQQSIYGFRHADVELFERRGAALAEVRARATLDTNFRSRPEILSVINGVFERVLGDRFRPLRAGRDAAPPVQAPGAPLVELLVADKGADWAMEGLGAPWRVAEARALAARLGRLLMGSPPTVAAREVVLLTRATTDLRVYERALEERGIPTYVIGGRGYWAHPQVIDMVSYLEALANPRAEEALFTVLASPMVGVSADALVILASAARGSGSRPPSDPWSVLREPGDALDGLAPAERDRLATFAEWFAAERRVAARTAVESLIDRGIERTGYDLAVLAMPGGERRLANVRKLMRLAREHEAVHGPDLHRFLELVARRARGGFGGGEARESEAPVEGEALDAVRLMTIHRAKGLEFGVVCVADLGRGPRWRAELLRVGRDGRFGLRLAEPGTGRRESALEYRTLGEERQAAEALEERRLFYVAMTRARERLILSGAAKLEAWPDLEGNGGGGGPIAWIGPAVAEQDGASVSFVSPEDLEAPAPPAPAQPPLSSYPPPPPTPQPPSPPAPPVAALSYTSLAEYRRCGYRFYVERVLRLPPGPDGHGGRGLEVAPGLLSATERGTLVHALLEDLDFRRPAVVTETMVATVAARCGLSVAPGGGDAAQIIELVDRFAGGELCRRLGRATGARREEHFRFLLGSAPGILIGGVFDVIAREPGGRTLIVDYKTDRLDGADPQLLADRDYGTQRLVYALAALRAGAEHVEVVHTFLELPQRPAVAHFTREQMPALEERLAALAGGVLRREFNVTDAPHRGVCAGCPAEGGLCSWPLEMTRREGADRLF